MTLKMDITEMTVELAQLLTDIKFRTKLAQRKEVFQVVDVGTPEGAATVITETPFTNPGLLEKVQTWCK